jgi:hypothetical protein
MKRGLSIAFTAIVIGLAASVGYLAHDGPPEVPPAPLVVMRDAAVSPTPDHPDRVAAPSSVPAPKAEPAPQATAAPAHDDDADDEADNERDELARSEFAERSEEVEIAIRDGLPKIASCLDHRVAKRNFYVKIAAGSDQPIDIDHQHLVDREGASFDARFEDCVRTSLGPISPSPMRVELLYQFHVTATDLRADLATVSVANPPRLIDLRRVAVAKRRDSGGRS